MRDLKNQEKDINDAQPDMEMIQQCLSICAQASVHINHIQHTIASISNPAQRKCEHASILDAAHMDALDAIEEWAEMLASTSMQLRNDIAMTRCHLDIHRLHISQPNHAPRTERHVARMNSSTRSCSSDQVNQARTNTFEAISTANGSQQILVSTSGHTIRARNVTSGSGSVQWLGQMSEISLQQLSGGAQFASLQSAQQQGKCRDN